MNPFTHGHMETSNGKRQMEAQAIFLNLLPFAHLAIEIFRLSIS
jgi:hypothetical protein